MADTYTTRSTPSPSDPAIGAIAIDYAGGDQTFTKNIRAIHISTAGSLKVDMADGTTPTFVLAVGTYPYAITKIYQTGSTTAAGHVLY